MLARILLCDQCRAGAIVSRLGEPALELVSRQHLGSTIGSRGTPKDEGAATALGTATNERVGDTMVHVPTVPTSAAMWLNRPRGVEAPVSIRPPLFGGADSS